MISDNYIIARRVTKSEIDKMVELLKSESNEVTLLPLDEKVGRWVADRYCSECDFDKKEFDYISGWKENYCPNCGCRMMEVKHD